MLVSASCRCEVTDLVGSLQAPVSFPNCGLLINQTLTAIRGYIKRHPDRRVLVVLVFQVFHFVINWSGERPVALIHWNVC